MASVKNLYCPSGVTNPVLHTFSGATHICQYPLVRSVLDRCFSMEQVFNCRYRFYWFYFSDLVQLIKVYFSDLVELHSIALPRRQGQGLQYYWVTCQLHSMLNQTGLSQHICKYIRMTPDQVFQHTSLVFR